MKEIVKNCKIHGDLTQKEIYKNRKCIKCSKLYAIKWQLENKEKNKYTYKKWKLNNANKMKIYRDTYKIKNNELKNIKDREYGKKYYNKNILERRKTILCKKKKEIIELSNTYVKSKLSRKYNIKIKDVPIWMVEIKKPLLLIKRKIKEIENANN